MVKDSTQFRQRFNRWKNGAKVYDAGKPISDDEYYSTMENVAKENWEKWGDVSEDAALTRILNANDYDYRGYYNKYPKSKANADTHWTDEFKTVYHPTFSEQSIYSGKKSKFNPEGLKGGSWGENDKFYPQNWQMFGTKYNRIGDIFNMRHKHINPISRYDTGNPPEKNHSEELLDQLSGTRFDPLAYKNWSENDESAKRYLISKKIRIHEDADDVRDFFDTYTHSDGYQRIIDNQYRWLESRHPYRKWISPKGMVSTEPSWYSNRKKLSEYVRDDRENKNNRTRIFALHGYPDMSFHSAAGTFVYKSPVVDGEQWFSPDFPNDFTLAHEYAHRFPQYYPGNEEVLQQNKNTKEGHDSWTHEKHSDMWGLKYLLYKEGIYDSRGKKDITPKQVGELRKKYPNLRPLIQMDDEKAAWMLNNTSKNNVPKNKHEELV